MKFGVMLPHRWLYARREEIASFAQRAESLGFHSAWVTDHVLVPKHRVERGHIFYEPLITLAFISAISSKIQLGTGVLILPVRNPLLLAKQVATLDALSGGRVILGVGMGWIKEELKAFGVEYGRRGELLRESVKTMRNLWSEGREGPKGMLFFPKPVSPRGPPIWVGGNKEPSIRLAAEVGDGWIPWAISAQSYARGRDLIKNSRGLGDFTLALATPVEIAARAPRVYEGVFKEVHHLISGTTQEVVKALEGYERVGVEYLVASFRDVRLFKDADTKRMRAQLELFAREVMPSF